jgi:2'-5' RNA ligase
MIRSFIAIELPESIHSSLAEEINQLRINLPGGAIRWARPAGIHLTLKFLGNIEESKLPDIKHLMHRIALQEAPFEFAVGGLGCFPNQHRPRVLWVGVEDTTGIIMRLQSNLERALKELGFTTEKRSFHPHLTLGRLRRDADNRDVAKLLETYKINQLGKVRVEEICLFQSDLRPQGAVYSKLAVEMLGRQR